MAELANELARRGHEVEFYSLPYLMGSKPKVDPHNVLDGVPYHEGWTHKIEADVAYTFYHPLSSLNFRVKGRKIASFHSEVFFQRSVGTRYGLVPAAASYGTKLIGRMELKAFDAVHTHFAYAHINHRKVYTIPGWVDTTVFKPNSIKYDDFTVLFSGRALWQKGWDIYVSLAKRMRNVGVRFFYVGGTVRDAAIHSLGFQSSALELSHIYNTSHALLSPSRSETFGRAAIESMACGTPVVTTPSALHTGLGLPFVFGTSLEDYESSLLNLKRQWEKGRPYLDLSNQCTKAAQAYSFSNVVSAYERMFAEVANGSAS